MAGETTAAGSWSEERFQELSAGMRRPTVAPWPEAETAKTVPSWASAMARTMARPRPLPRGLPSASPCVKRSKSQSTSSSDSPGPRSVTEISSPLRP